ncbi:MAG: hypothetical protein O7H39_07745 [Gammaproteobacteria bacterium]|nr:hypothetical protein [Gammaproteobacteria bacterium]
MPALDPHAGSVGRRWALALPTGKLALAVVAMFVPATIETNALNQYAAAKWLSEHTAEEDRAGSWNLGHIAYFTERTVINLDGLVNDREYYGRLQRGLGGESYLIEQDVRWIVHRADGALDKPGTVWDGCRSTDGKS